MFAIDEFIEKVQRQVGQYPPNIEIVVECNIQTFVEMSGRSGLTANVSVSENCCMFGLPVRINEKLNYGEIKFVPKDKVLECLLVPWQ